MRHARVYESLPPSGILPPPIPPFMAPVIVPGLRERVDESYQPFVPSRPTTPHVFGGNTASYSEHVLSQPRQSSTSIQAPVIPPVAHSATSTSVQTRPITPPTTAAVNSVPVHVGVVCDECDRMIVGVRHKCLDCSGSLSLLRPHLYTLIIGCRFRSVCAMHGKWLCSSSQPIP